MPYVLISNKEDEAVRERINYRNSMPSALRSCRKTATTRTMHVFSGMKARIP